MLWNTLKKKIELYVISNPLHEGAAYIRREAGYANLSIVAYLDTVDIRDVAKLRGLVPKAFPQPLRADRMLILTNNIHGKWRVDLEPAPKRNRYERPQPTRR